MWLYPQGIRGYVSRVGEVSGWGSRGSNEADLRRQRAGPSRIGEQAVGDPAQRER